VDLKKYTNFALYSLLLNSCMWNKFKNSSKERIDFLLQDLWNNISYKTCGYRSHAYYKRVWWKHEQFDKRKKKNTTIKIKNKNCLVGQFLIFFFRWLFQKGGCATKKIPRRAWFVNF